MTDGPDPRRVEYRRLSTIEGDPRNPKAHATDDIVASVQRFGFLEPAVVDERTGRLVSGHGRIDALRKICRDGGAAPEGVRVTKKDWLVPVVVGWASGSDLESGAALIALNRTNELGGWVDDALLDLLHELEDAGEAAAAAYDAEAIEDLRTTVAKSSHVTPAIVDPDAAPEPPAEPRARLGDVYRLGPHRVMCGDATDAGAYAALLGGKRADCMWTDPPYGVDYVGRTKDALTIQNDGAADLPTLLGDAFPQSVAALRPGAPVYVATAQGVGQLPSWEALRAAGVDVRQQLIWVKPSLVLGRSDYHYRHEPILYGFTPALDGSGRLGRGGKRWHGDNARTTVFEAQFQGRKVEVTLADLARAVLDGTLGEYVVDVRDVASAIAVGLPPSTVFEVDKPSASREHPTMKPVELIEAMLRNSAKPGDVVLDPFGGSGSTLIAAERLGLRARLIELDPRYVDVIVTRWEQATGGVAVLERDREDPDE